MMANRRKTLTTITITDRVFLMSTTGIVTQTAIPFAVRVARMIQKLIAEEEAYD